jgi:ribonuclease BN (tRNA processing enzyme)
MANRFGSDKTMKKDSRGISRREFLAGSLAVTGGALLSGRAQGQEDPLPPPPKKQGARLILLGTGGGPDITTRRNRPASVVLVDNVPYVFDCGTGVSRQLVLAGIPLRTLRYVFVTHHHSDHNLEYGNLIYNAWASGFKGAIDTYGPPPLENMTKLFFELNAYDINIRIPDEGRPPLVPMVTAHSLGKPGLVLRNDKVKVTAAAVNHPPVWPSFAYRIDAPGRSIVFSGDTTPSDNLIELSQGADTLVHEAFYTEALPRHVGRSPAAHLMFQHVVGSHTPIEEVGKLAQKAGVKTLVLNHLVPGSDPSITDDMWNAPVKAVFKGQVIVGKDLLEV